MTPRQIAFTIFMLAAIAFFSGMIVYAAIGDTDLGKGYDADDSGRIERSEAEQAALDYFADEIDQDQALDVFLMHFADVQLATSTPTATPTPAATSTPIATSTPVATSTPAAAPDCETETLNGWQMIGERVSRLTAVKRTFEITNPEGTWEYGFSLGRVFGGSVPWETVLVSLTSDGEWQITHWDSGQPASTDTGAIPDYADFDTAAGATNEVSFLGHNHSFRLTVNGQMELSGSTRSLLPAYSYQDYHTYASTPTSYCS